MGFEGVIKKLDRGRSRTCNLLIRSQTRCHFATRPIICVRLLSPPEATKRSLDSGVSLRKFRRQIQRLS